MLNSTLCRLLKKPDLRIISVLVLTFAFYPVANAEVEQKNKEQQTDKRTAFVKLLPHNNTNECKLRGYRPPFNKPPYNRHKYNECLKMIENLTQEIDY